MKNLIAIVLFAGTMVIAQEIIPLGDEIVEKMTSIMTQENSKGIMTQTITTSSGKQRTFEFEMFTYSYQKIDIPVTRRSSRKGARIADLSA